MAVVSKELEDLRKVLLKLKETKWPEIKEKEEVNVKVKEKEKEKDDKNRIPPLKFPFIRRPNFPEYSESTTLKNLFDALSFYFYPNVGGRRVLLVGNLHNELARCHSSNTTPPQFLYDWIRASAYKYKNIPFNIFIESNIGTNRRLQPFQGTMFGEGLSAIKDLDYFDNVTIHHVDIRHHAKFKLFSKNHPEIFKNIHTALKFGAKKAAKNKKIKDAVSKSIFPSKKLFLKGLRYVGEEEWKDTKSGVKNYTGKSNMIIMDAFLLALLFSKKDAGSICIVHAGDAHIRIYEDFISGYFDQMPLISNKNRRASCILFEEPFDIMTNREIRDIVPLKHSPRRIQNYDGHVARTIKRTKEEIKRKKGKKEKGKKEKRV